MSELTRRQEPPLARLVGRRPTQGASGAAKVVISDVQSLVRAEIQLAKAEITDGIKAKVTGGALFIAAAIVGWLAIQAFLVLLGFLFALFLPGWAAVGLVLLLLLVLIGVLGWMGLQKVKVPASLDRTKATITESQEAAKAAVAQAQVNAREGVQEVKVTLSETAADIKSRIDERRGNAT